jgi:hypothetical protein
MTAAERPGAEHIARIVATAPTLSEVGKAKLAVLLWAGRDRQEPAQAARAAARSAA